MAKIKPMLKCKGSVTFNGEELFSVETAQVVATINSNKHKSLGNDSSTTRIINADLKTTLKRYKVDNYVLNLYKNYISKGVTPELTLVLQNNDKSSSYFDKYKKNNTITIKGAVPTGDITLMDLDASSSDFVEEELTFEGGTLT